GRRSTYRRGDSVQTIGTSSADWREVARVVLHIDPESAPDRARNAYHSHLARAKWMTERGRLLCGVGDRIRRNPSTQTWI
ncbi:hypothetical protein ACFFWD_27635, partial [Bradyrhizobium erythrophlei]